MCKDLWDLLPVNFMSFGWSCVDAVQFEIGYITQNFWEGWTSVSIFYMAEGTEKSHHTATKDYNTNTMRDGSNDACNMSYSYIDVQFSFYRAIDLCSSKSATLESYRKFYGKSNLEICREPIPEPELDYLRIEDLFRGMHFVLLETYGHLKETQASLEKKITENGGNVVSKVDTITEARWKFWAIIIAFYQIENVSTHSLMVNQVKKKLQQRPFPRRYSLTAFSWTLNL